MKVLAFILGVGAIVFVETSATTAQASKTPILITPSRTTFDEIKVWVSFDDRPESKHMSVIVYNQKSADERPSITGWLRIYAKGTSDDVAIIPVVGEESSGAKNAVIYKFALAHDYRASSIFIISPQWKKGDGIEHEEDEYKDLCLPTNTKKS